MHMQSVKGTLLKREYCKFVAFDGKGIVIINHGYLTEKRKKNGCIQIYPKEIFLKIVARNNQSWHLVFGKGKPHD